MPQLTTPKGIAEIKRYAKSYNRFRGVDFSTDPTQVSDQRSPFCQNLIADLAGFPEKRPGWRTVLDVGERINGMHYAVFASGVAAVILHAGEKLYSWQPGADTAAEFYTAANDARSRTFAHKGKLYFLDGKKYIVITEENGTFSAAPVTDNAFVPTTTIGMPAAGGGTPFEAVNMLTPRRINSLVGDGTSTLFRLDAEDIDAVLSVTVEGEKKAEETDYTVDLAAGTVTFTNAPPEYAGGGGIDNVIIEFSKAVEGYTDRVDKCTFAESYGYNNDNRFFISGNPEYKNWDWQSGLDDPTYYPDTGYTMIGADTSAIMGYIKQYDTLTVIKEDNEQDAEVFLRTAAMTEDGKVYFPVKQGIKGLGAVSMNAFGTLRDDPLFLTKEGVYAIVTTTVQQERALQDRSFYVNAKLTKEENLKDAVAVVWNGHYILAVNGRAYVADGRQQTGQSRTEQYSYEWFYWTNIPARVFMELSGELFFGTEDGRICKFNTDIETMDRFNDDGAPIVARWSTKADALGTFARRKTMVKKGSMVVIKPYTRSSVKVYVATDKEHERFIKQEYMDIFTFADIDFSRFTFNTLDSAQVIPFNTKVKKFITLQMIFENDAANEGWGIYGAEIQYTVGNYVK